MWPTRSVESDVRDAELVHAEFAHHAKILTVSSKKPREIRTPLRNRSACQLEIDAAIDRIDSQPPTVHLAVASIIHGGTWADNRAPHPDVRGGCSRRAAVPQGILHSLFGPHFRVHPPREPVDLDHSQFVRPPRDQFLLIVGADAE